MGKGVSTSYYDSGGTEKQKIVTPAPHDRLDGGNDGDRVQSHERPRKHEPNDIVVVVFVIVVPSLPTLSVEEPSRNRISSWNPELKKLKENKQHFTHEYDGSNDDGWQRQ